MRWRQAEATVGKGEVVPKGTMYRARIVVSFDAAGQHVETEAEHPYSGSNFAWISKHADDFPAGSRIVIRYDPDDPQSARLNPGVNFDTFGIASILLGAALLFGIVALLAYGSAKRSRVTATNEDDEVAARALRVEWLGFSAFVGVIGLSLLAGSFFAFRIALEKKEWPVIDGRVAASEVIARRVSKARQLMYATRVHFSYVVAGKSYVTPVDSNTSRSSKARTEEILATEYRRDSVHPLRMNPRNPHDVTLASDSLFFLPLALGAGGALTFALIALVSMKFIRR
jgi:hypothetical protein